MKKFLQISSILALSLAVEKLIQTILISLLISPMVLVYQTMMTRLMTLA